MKHKALLALILALPWLEGCILPPQNSLLVTLPNGTKVSYTSRKQVKITDFKSTHDTNGVPLISFSNLESTNDPQVINATAAGQVAIMKEAGNLFEKGLKAIPK